LSRPNWSCRRR